MLNNYILIGAAVPAKKALGGTPEFATLKRKIDPVTCKMAKDQWSGIYFQIQSYSALDKYHFSRT